MFDGVTLPFTVAEMIEAAMAILKLVGPFILVGLALVFTPKFISVIRSSASGGRNR